MSKEYFFLYLVYGFAYIIMGIFSIQKKDTEVINLPLVKSIKYLGYFGITHGISEWITMIIIIELYPNLYIPFAIIKQLLKALSFAFLIYFGISLLPGNDKYKNIVKKTPFFVFVLWLTGFLSLIRFNGLAYHIINPEYNTITLRYIMAFSGGLISSIALYLNAKLFEKRKLNKVAKRYKRLAYAFLIYGLLDGLIVKKMDFFPANIINDELFLSYFRFPIQILNVLIGIAIIFILIKVIDTFSWQQKEKLNRLQRNIVSSEERRKLGLEIHDSIMQSLYATGLKVEFLIKDNTLGKADKILREIKDDLKNTIEKTREFLRTTSLDIIELEDLDDTLQLLVKRFNDNQNTKLNFNSKIALLNLGQLSTEKSTQIYYMIQEAITNIARHSKATNGEILLEAKNDYLYIKITDNGIGISIDNINSNEQFGISSMKERTEKIGGIFNIEKIKQGTKVEFIIPWEETSYEE